MNNPVPSSEDSRLDEWGKYIMKREDVMKIDKDGVPEAIRDNNPAVTAVSVFVDGSDHAIDWGDVGRYLGHSKHVKHLVMNFLDIIDLLDLQSFCGGLAVNKSVESLVIYLDFGLDLDDDEIEDGNEQERRRSFPSELIGILLPFFENNGNLIAVDFSFEYNTPSIGRVSDVISASLALKSIKIKCGSEHSLIKLASAICKKEGVRHITINGGSLDKSACRQIKKFLSGAHCHLKSLILSDLRVSDNVCIDNIIIGIFSNKSLECLQLSVEDYTRPFLKSLQHTKLSSIKTLRLTPIELPSIGTLCQQMPNIKTLNLLHDCQLNLSTWGTSLRNMEPTSSSTLQDLMMKSITPNEALLGELSSCLSNCHLLKSLSLQKSVCPQEQWINIFNSIPTAPLESISISDTIRSDSVMTSFCNWISSIQTIMTLHIINCRHVRSDGMQSLATALESLTNIEEVYFVYLNPWDQHDAPNNMNMLLSVLVGKTTLKKLSVPVANNNQLQTIANALEDPACSLTELTIQYCRNEGLQRLGYREREQLSQIMVNALHRNTTLKSLVFETRSGENLIWWSMISDLLCNESSVDATYLSNHTLQSLPSYTWNYNVVPIWIYSMLHSNKVSDKHAVAREKILQHHKLEDVNFVPSSLPVALAWIGKSDSNFGLSQQYRLIRSAPHLIQNDQKKRKRQEFD